MELAQLEALCERLYNSQDSVERAHAENTLKCFSMNTEYISQCQYILDHALTPYALMLASSSLLKQVTEHSLALKLRLDIWSYLINYLATRGPELQPFVTASLIQLLCRLTKFGWFDDGRFRDIVKESMNFLSQVISCQVTVLCIEFLILIGFASKPDSLNLNKTEALIRVCLRCITSPHHVKVVEEKRYVAVF